MLESWEWRRNYRAWEAERKVFVYPENWIEPELRVPLRPLDDLRQVAIASRADGRRSLLLTGSKPGVALIAGRALAEDLGLDLYRVDLSHVMRTSGGFAPAKPASASLTGTPHASLRSADSLAAARSLHDHADRAELGEQLVSNYIGETEKNLDRVFDAVERADVVLLLDEADALIGKRSQIKDVHDRYANAEVSYLLRKIETCAGLVVLATNATSNVDDPFRRRFAFVIDLPNEPYNPRRQ